MNCCARWHARSIVRCRLRWLPWIRACCENRPVMASFFENQALARRNTKLLVLMYFLAVAGVIIAVDLVLAGVWIYGVGDMYVPKGRSPGPLALLGAVPAKVFLLGALGTALVIFAVSGWNIVQLSSGGKAVAEMVGARR